MNKIILDQLSKCQVANISNYNKDTNTYHIPKHVDKTLEQDKYYLIELDDVSMSEDSFITINCNGGNIPPSKYLKVDVIKIVNDLVNVNGIGFNMDTKQDTQDVWSGWLSLSHLKIIEEL